MLITVGVMTRHVDGCLSGVLRTLTIRTQIELRPVDTSDGGPDFEVVIGSGFVAGYATSRGTEIDIVVMSLEFPQPVRMRAAPRDESRFEWTLLWEVAG